LRDELVPARQFLGETGVTLIDDIGMPARLDEGDA
jgi:hypothetical protein